MRRALVGILLLAALAGGVGLGAAFFADDGSSATTGATPAGPGQERQGIRDLTQIAASLPKGFTVRIVVEKLPYATTFALDGRGGLYLVLTGDGKAAVIHLADGNRDGVMERRTRFAELPSLVSGFLVRPKGVLIGVRGTVLLATDRNHDNRADSLRPFIQHLPVSTSINIHSNNGMALGPDGRIYFGLGATCNACVEKDPRSATIMSCAASGRDCKVFARGLRNAWDLAFHPTDGTLWAGDNGPDPIGGAHVDAQDEVNWVRQGLNYGFPFCWGNGKGFDCEKREPSAVELEPHSAPAGVAFSTGDAFPAEYRNNLFVALWGGRRVIRVTMKRAGTDYRAHASDFVSLDRPIDVVEDVDGSLPVLDADAARDLPHRLQRLAPVTL